MPTSAAAPRTMPKSVRNERSLCASTSRHPLEIPITSRRMMGSGTAGGLGADGLGRLHAGTAAAATGKLRARIDAFAILAARLLRDGRGDDGKFALEFERPHACDLVVEREAGEELHEAGVGDANLDGV